MRNRRWVFLLAGALLVVQAADGAVWASRAAGSSYIEEFRNLIPTRDGGYFGVGEYVYFQGFSFYFRAWVAKLDGTGNVKWNKVVSGGWIDSLDVALELSDGNFIAGGDIKHTAYLAKIAPAGKILWDWMYPGAESSSIYCAIPVSGNGLVAVGHVNDGAGFDAWCLKLDKDGKIVWQQSFGGSGSDYAYAVQPAAGGGYFVSGSTDSFGAGDDDAWILKLDAEGRILWQQAFGGAKADFTHLSGLAATSDGGCIAAGMTESYGAGNEDGWVLRLDKTGKVKWQTAVGGKSDDCFYSVRQTSDKGFILAGETESFGAGKTDAWTVRLNALGRVLWQYTHGGTGSDGVRSILQTPNGEFLAGGGTYSYGAGSGDGLTLRVSKTGFVCNPLSRKSAAAAKATTAKGKATAAALVATAVVPVKPSVTITSPKHKNTLICSR